MGQSPPGTTYNEDGNGLPFFQGKAEFGNIYPAIKKWCSAPSKIAMEGDILLSVRAPVGPTNIAPCESCIGRGLSAIRARSEVAEQKYLWFFFKHLEPILSKRGQGSTFAAIKRSEVNEIKIPLPPLSEQQQIVKILAQADRLRRLRADADGKAQRILPALFIKMFGDPVANKRSWHIDKFGNAGTLERGKSKHRPRNNPILLGGPHPLIQTGDVANSGGRIRNYTQTYSDIGLSQSRMWPRGTLCITIAANIAKTGVLEFDACFPDSVVGFHPGPDVTTEYVQSWLWFLQPVLENNAPQAAQKNINLKVLRDLPIPIPPKHLQEKFSGQAKYIYQQRNYMRKESTKLEILFKSLLHHAFIGDLTASWREAHMKELLQEMERQSSYLEKMK